MLRTLKDWSWCVANNSVGAELENASEWMAQLAGQDLRLPNCKLTTADLSQFLLFICYRKHLPVLIMWFFPTQVIQGAGGFELVFHPKMGTKIWVLLVLKRVLLTALNPFGLGARDTLLTRKRFSVRRQWHSRYYFAIEAGLGWITKFVDGKDFHPLSVARNKNRRRCPELLRFELTERGIPVMVTRLWRRQPYDSAR